MQLLTFASFIFFTSLVGILTYFLTRGDDHASSDGYFLGGRRLTGGIIAGSLLLTNLSTEQLVGLNGAAFSDGLSVMAWEVIAGASLIAMALFFLPRYLRSVSIIALASSPLTSSSWPTQSFCCPWFSTPAQQVSVRC